MSESASAALAHTLLTTWDSLQTLEDLKLANAQAIGSITGLEVSASTLPQPFNSPCPL